MRVVRHPRLFSKSSLTHCESLGERCGMGDFSAVRADGCCLKKHPVCCRRAQCDRSRLSAFAVGEPAAERYDSDYGRCWISAPGASPLAGQREEGDREQVTM